MLCTLFPFWKGGEGGGLGGDEDGGVVAASALADDAFPARSSLQVSAISALEGEGAREVREDGHDDDGRQEEHAWAFRRPATGGLAPPLLNNALTRARRLDRRVSLSSWTDSPLSVRVGPQHVLGPSCIRVSVFGILYPHGFKAKPKTRTHPAHSGSSLSVHRFFCCPSTCAPSGTQLSTNMAPCGGS